MLERASGLFQLLRGGIEVVHHQCVDPSPEPRLHPSRLRGLQILEAGRKQLGAKLIAHAQQLRVVHSATAVELGSLGLHALTLRFEHVPPRDERRLLRQQAITQPQQSRLRVQAQRLHGAVDLRGGLLRVTRRRVLLSRRNIALSDARHGFVRQQVARGALVERCVLVAQRL